MNDNTNIPPQDMYNKAPKKFSIGSVTLIPEIRVSKIQNTVPKMKNLFASMLPLQIKGKGAVINKKVPINMGQIKNNGKA